MQVNAISEVLAQHVIISNLGSGAQLHCAVIADDEDMPGSGDEAVSECNLSRGRFCKLGALHRIRPVLAPARLNLARKRPSGAYSGGQSSAERR